MSFQNILGLSPTSPTGAHLTRQLPSRTLSLSSTAYAELYQHDRLSLTDADIWRHFKIASAYLFLDT